MRREVSCVTHPPLANGTCTKGISVTSSCIAAHRPLRLSLGLPIKIKIVKESPNMKSESFSSKILTYMSANLVVTSYQI
jgi:hypothetical protein